MRNAGYHFDSWGKTFTTRLCCLSLYIMMWYWAFRMNYKWFTLVNLSEFKFCCKPNILTILWNPQFMFPLWKNIFDSALFMWICSFCSCRHHMKMCLAITGSLMHTSVKTGIERPVDRCEEDSTIKALVEDICYGLYQSWRYSKIVWGCVDIGINSFSINRNFVIFNDSLVTFILERIQMPYFFTHICVHYPHFFIFFFIEDVNRLVIS